MDRFDIEAEREGRSLNRAPRFNSNARRRETTSRKGTNHVFGGDGRSTGYSLRYGADGQIPSKA